ncbi:MAG: cupin [Micavibrio sp. TMED27]|nr:cupin [Micavibrio sp.]OUT92606.1 MAG: cupin [Micavibrio sp. TMED27]|tara:strand:+ start:2860 stop:3414 length:555 start_codon:yes stop_codon:yes gene_type:complete
MSRLTIYPDSNPDDIILDTQDGDEIARTLSNLDVRFERWSASKEFANDAADETVIEAYKTDIERIKAEGGYQTVDILRVNEETPNKPAIRAKFLNEHTHSEDEVRFFVDGAGSFYLRLEGRVHIVLCERGDLISVPAGVQHWFDMGADPRITALRFFDNQEGWVPHFTGSDIAEKFPKFDETNV